MALGDYGLEVPCFIAVRSWGETAGREYQLALDEVKRRFELADRFNCPLVVCTPPLDQPGFEQLHTRYRDLLEIGDASGVTAVLEYLSFFASLNNVPDTVSVLEKVEHPKKCTILDAFHTWNNRTTQEDIAKLPLEWISHYHIDDAHPGIPRFKQLDGNRVMVGDGVIDLKSELTLLKNKGYDKWLSLELFSEEWWNRDPMETARIGFERMKELATDVGWDVE
jgi:sugar phosphate isomerase/epimerase